MVGIGGATAGFGGIGGNAFHDFGYQHVFDNNTV